MMAHGVIAEAAENDAGDVRVIAKPSRDGSDRDLGCPVPGKAIDSGRYGWKRNGADAIGFSVPSRVAEDLAAGSVAGD